MFLVKKIGVFTMGGMGSGSWYRRNKKTTTDEVHWIDIRYLRKQGVLRWPGYTGSLSWSRGGEQTGSIRFRVEQDRLVLMYRSRFYGGEWQEIEEQIKFYNNGTAIADLNTLRHWSKKSYWAIDEVTTFSFERNPKQVYLKRIEPHAIHIYGRESQQHQFS
jgi:hypothetical protein